MDTDEHFRVGYNFDTDRITLTVLANGGASMTLSMSESGVRHMIKMLEAAIPEQIQTEQENT
jgi:hypothetical protein